MPISSSDLERVRPAGEKRSSKRDLIVNVFLDLICKTCNQSSEFLSSDIEALMEEVASARSERPLRVSEAG
jgi:hypothetical protein